MTDTILMCEPKYFAVSYEINPWMSGNIGSVDKSLATRQWNCLAEEIAKRANIKLVEPVDELPDMVFTANAAYVFDDKNVKYAITSTFRNVQRKGEEAHFEKWFANNGFTTIIPPSPLTFEGAGDCLTGEDDMAWVGHGFRSTQGAGTFVTSTLHQHQMSTNLLELTDARFYHLDTCFCPINNGFVLYFPKAFSEQSQNKIVSYYNGHSIPVTEEDATMFACNAVNIGNTIILNKASDNLKNRLNNIGFKVIEVDLSEFMKSGGAAKCLTLKL